MSVLDDEELSKLLLLVKNRSKTPFKKKVVKDEVLIDEGEKIHKSNMEIEKDVTIKVSGYDSTNQKPEYATYVESKYKGWKIRVWEMHKEKSFGCNYYKGEDLRFAQIPFTDVKDINGAFRYVSLIIKEIENE